eukprot:511254-Rhodomonas_salina.2
MDSYRATHRPADPPTHQLTIKKTAHRTARIPCFDGPPALLPRPSPPAAATATAPAESWFLLCCRGPQ